MYYAVPVVLVCVRQLLRLFFFFFLMIRRPPRSTLDRSSAASDVYKRQLLRASQYEVEGLRDGREAFARMRGFSPDLVIMDIQMPPVSYTHLRAHETVLDLVCRLLLEKKK